MSISNLLSDNNFNIFGNSLTTNSMTTTSITADSLTASDTTMNLTGSLKIIKNNTDDPYIYGEEVSGNKRFGFERNGINGLALNFYDNTDDSIVRAKISNTNASFIYDGLALGDQNETAEEILDVAGNIRIRNCGELLQTCDDLPNGEYKRIVKSVQTTDATTKEIYSLRIFPSDFIRLDGTVSCKENDSSTVGNCATWTVKGFVNRASSGGADLIYSSVVADDKSWSNSLDVTITENNDITVNVVGLAATKIDWYCGLNVLHYNTP